MASKTRVSNKTKQKSLFERYINFHLIKYFGLSLMFAVMLSLLGLTYQTWQEHYKIISQIASLQSVLHDQQKQIVEQTQIMTRQSKQLDKVIHSPLKWKYDLERFQINWLLKQAQFILQTQQNPSLSLTLLHQVQLILEKSKYSVKYSSLLRYVDQDVAALKLISKTRNIDIYNRLTNLRNKLIQLSFKRMPHKNANVIKNNNNDMPAWRKTLFKSWEIISKAIIIQKHSKLVENVLSDTQRQIIILRFQTLISTAQYAALKHQEKLYHDSLSQINDDLQRYFINPNAILEKLDGLNKSHVYIKIPKLISIQYLPKEI